MALKIPFFRKKQKQEDNKDMTTLEEIKKAYADLSEDDKKHFDEYHRGYQQTVSDRVHESLAAQERENGQEDSQSAEAREHEALGEEHADGKGDVEELHESDDTPEEKREDRADERREERQADGVADLRERISKLEERLANADKATMEEKRQKYGLGSHFVPQGKEEVYDEKRINNLLGK